VTRTHAVPVEAAVRVTDDAVNGVDDCRRYDVQSVIHPTQRQLFDS
jgi:hypothetical protein